MIQGWTGNLKMISHNAKNNGYDLWTCQQRQSKPLHRVKLNQKTTEGTASARRGGWPDHSCLYQRVS